MQSRSKNESVKNYIGGYNQNKCCNNQNNFYLFLFTRSNFDLWGLWSREKIKLKVC